MSAPINFNTASFEELKTVLSKNKSYAVIEARKRFGGHLTIKQFRTAAKLSGTTFQQMVDKGDIIYEVDTSSQNPSQDTPPTSPEDIPPVSTGDNNSVPAAAADLGNSGFQLVPAKLPFNPSGPPYVEVPGGGPIPGNGVPESINAGSSVGNGDTGDPLSRPLPARTTTPEGGNPAPPNGPESPASGGAQPLNNPGPTSPKSNPQLEALAKELAEMRAKLAQKETESLDFRAQLSEAQQQLTVSQGESLCFQQQLGQAQQTAEQSTQKVEQYKKIAREVEEKAKKELGQVQNEVQQYRQQAQEFEDLAKSLGKDQKDLDLKVARARNEKKRITAEYEREAKRATELRNLLKDRDTYHDNLMKEEEARVREMEQKWRDEAAQRQTLQQSVREREEQLAQSGSQTPSGYFTDATSETSSATGSSVSRASHHAGQGVNPPRGAMGGNPPIPQWDPGLVPNILNPINPHPQPQANIVPQGNVQPNVPQPAQPARRPRHENNQPQVLPPAYRDYRLDNQPGGQLQQPPQAPSIQDNPPPYAPYDGGVPPYGQNPLWKSLSSSGSLPESRGARTR